MIGAARSLATRALRAHARGLQSSAVVSRSDMLPPIKVAVTGAAGQIGYALVMRIAR
jgi:hypothetical protein